MPTNLRQLLAPLVGLLLVTACAAAPGPSTSAAPPTTAPAAAPPTAAAAVAKPAVSPPPVAASSAASSPVAKPAAVPSASPAAQAAAARKPAAGSVSGEIVVFAASSLTDVFGDMATAFQQGNPNARLTFNFGASSQLATQLGLGARADAFAGADQAQMDAARRANVIPGSERMFVQNRLVVIAPRDNPSQLKSLTATYPIARARGRYPNGGQAFIDYVLADAGQHVFGRWGFLQISPTLVEDS